MKTLLTFVLLGLVAAGCAPVPSASSGAAPTGAPAETPAGVLTAPGASSSSHPLSVTANPPRILLGPILGTPAFPGETPTPLTPAGWQTFTSQALGVAVDFPAGWTAVEGTGSVQFNSPQGATISLAGTSAAPDNSASFECTNLLMASGLSAEACGDPTSNRYYASFHWTSADGSSHAAVLSTQGAAALEVYKSMLASLRPAQ